MALTHSGRFRLNWLLLALMLAALSVRSWIAFLPVERSFRISVPDDAYYYFSLARNVTAGHGLTVDGFSPTNGFHPLWLSFIVPFWLLVPGAAILPIQLSLAASAVFDTLAGVMLYRLALRLVSDVRLALLAPALYWSNPYGIALGVDGLETSLAVCLFGSALLVSWRLLDDVHTTSSTRKFFVVGCLWGLLMTARTDFVFVACGMCVYLCGRHLNDWQSFWRQAIALGIGCALPLLPWVGWNLSMFGTATQVSHDAYPFYLHTLWLADNGNDLGRLLQTEADIIYRDVGTLSHVLGLGRTLPVVAAAIALAIWRTRTATSRRALKRLLWPSLLACIPLMYHIAYRWFFQPWYAMPLNFLLALWLTVALAALHESRHPQALGLALVCVLALYASAALDIVQRGGIYPGQRVVVSRDYCGGLSRIGFSDSGFEGYFAECTIVNLDGVVNNRAFIAIKNRAFYRYLDEIRIERIALNRIIARVVELQEGPIPANPPWSKAESAK